MWGRPAVTSTSIAEDRDPMTSGTSQPTASPAWVLWLVQLSGSMVEAFTWRDRRVSSLLLALHGLKRTLPHLGQCDRSALGYGTVSAEGQLSLTPLLIQEAENTDQTAHLLDVRQLSTLARAVTEPVLATAALEYAHGEARRWLARHPDG